MTSFTRRRFLASAFAAVPGSYLAIHAPRLLAQAATARPDRVAEGRAAAASAKITSLPLRGNISVLMGSGGNIAVLPGRDGLVMVDSGFSTSKPQITAALAALDSTTPGSAAPKHLINTHWHFDHTDGNEWVHGAGAVITAHRRTRERMSTTQTIAAFQLTLPPSPTGALPTELFDTTKSMRRNSMTIELNHYAPAHTDTDISVLFVEPDVMHLGDTWFNGMYPFIDASSGGTIDGMIAAAARTLAACRTTTILIPGHGPIGNKEDLTAFHDMLAGVRDNVAALKQQGRTLDETVAAQPTAAYDAKFGHGFLPAAGFVGFVYAGV